MEYYTYAYLREDRTPYYVGKGKGRRVYLKHQKGISVPKDKTRIIFLKQNLTEEEAFKHEIYMIAVFGRKDLGTGILYNKTDGGDGISGFVRNDEWKRKQSEAKKNMSDETRKKMSEAQRGRTHSKEHRAKITKATKGQTRSEETKRKISEAKKGKPRSEQSRLKQSETTKGRPLSESHKLKLSVVMKGKTLSEETKRKMSEAQKGKTISEETKRKMSEAQKKKKWWTDGCGNSVFSVECPGIDWYNGRGKLIKKH